MVTACNDLNEVDADVRAPVPLRAIRGWPVGHAAYRLAEMRALASERLATPVLDLGCGDGRFAASFIDSPIDVGLDAHSVRTRLAAATGAYHHVCRGDARRMPFPDESFGTVVSVSVLEHVDEAERAVHEAFRVLREGGRCVMTIAIADLRDHLYYRPLFERAGVAWLGRAYTRVHDRAFGHVSLRTRQEWEAAFLAAGFQIVESRKICSPALTRLWDALLPLAAPGRVLAALGLPALPMPRRLRSALWRRFEPLIEQDTGEGSSLLIVAEKPARFA